MYFKEYCHSQSMDVFVVFVNVSTRAQTSLHLSTHNQWRIPLIVKEQHSSKYVHIFSCKHKNKWNILPSSIYTTDNGDSLALLFTGHLSSSSARTHCNHSIRLLYIGDPALISSMFQIDASSKVSSSRMYVYTSKTF